MNTTQIQKSIDLLKSGKLEELENFLKVELIKSSTSKSRQSLLTAVSKYLKSKYIGRKELENVQLYNNKQFVVNGFTVVQFKNHVQELEVLPCVDSTINFDRLFASSLEFTQVEDDELLLLKNLSKYIKLYKSKYTPIYFRDWYFDAKLLKEVIDIIQDDLDNLKIAVAKQSGAVTGMYFETNTTRAIVLPLREELEHAKHDTKEFLNILKGAKE